MRFFKIRDDGVYGAQLWLNHPEPAGERRKLYPDLPADTVMARGHSFQIVAAIPSQDAVIVRLGWTPEGHIFDWNKHLSRTAAALAPTGSAP